MHPDVLRGQHKKSSKKATVEDVEDDDDDWAVKRKGKKSSVNSIIEDNIDEDNEEMSYLEDTETRGYKFTLFLYAFTESRLIGSLAQRCAKYQTSTTKIRFCGITTWRH